MTCLVQVHDDVLDEELLEEKETTALQQVEGGADV